MCADNLREFAKWKKKAQGRYTRIDIYTSTGKYISHCFVLRQKKSFIAIKPWTKYIFGIMYVVLILILIHYSANT